MSSTTKNTSAADKKNRVVRKVKKADEPVEAPVAEPTPAKEDPPKKSKKTAKSKPVTEDTTQSASTSTDITTKTGGDPGEDLVERFDLLLKKMDEDRQRLKENINEVRDMRKQFRRKMREMNKKKRRDHKGGNANKAPSGFAQPCKISDELCDFLGEEHGTLVPRTHVTKEIINHVKSKDLQDPSNRKRIIPDEALRRLVGDVDDLTFFNLQVHLNPHFPRKAKKESDAVAAPAAA